MFSLSFRVCSQVHISQDVSNPGRLNSGEFAHFRQNNRHRSRQKWQIISGPFSSQRVPKIFGLPHVSCGTQKNLVLSAAGV